MTLPFLDYYINICIVDRPLSNWMTDDIRALKIIRRKNEVIWRKDPLYKFV